MANGADSTVIEKLVATDSMYARCFSVCSFGATSRYRAM